MADLAQFLQENPISSPEEVVDTVLYDFNMWVGLRKAMKAMRSKVCVEFEAGSAEGLSDGKLSQPNEPPVNFSRAILPRSISLWRETWQEHGDYHSIDYMPWLGRIFEGIRMGKVICFYEKVATDSLRPS